MHLAFFLLSKHSTTCPSYLLPSIKFSLMVSIPSREKEFVAALVMLDIARNPNRIVPLILSVSLSRLVFFKFNG